MDRPRCVAAMLTVFTFACALESGRAGDGSPLLRAPVNTVLQSDVVSVDSGDLNGDGKLDVVVTSASQFSERKTEVLLGDGDGTFQNPIESVYIADQTAVGDFDGDGHLDRFGWNADRSIVVAYGLGDGTFGAQKETAQFTQVLDPVFADFNGDGRLDYAGLGTFTSVAIGLNAPSGLFETRYVVNAHGQDNQDLVVCDFNEDGMSDVATVNAAGVDILFNKENAKEFVLSDDVLTAQASSHSLVTADFNRDGHLDIAVANISAVRMHYGLGDGSFVEAESHPTLSESGIADLVAGDFDGDGFPDLAWFNWKAGGAVGDAQRPRPGTYVTYAFGNGDASGLGFPERFSVATGEHPNGLATGDFNGDGRLDVLASHKDSRSLAVILGDPDGSIFASPGLGLDVFNRFLGTGDADGDGRGDLLVTGDHPNFTLPNETYVLFGKGGGGFEPIEIEGVEAGTTSTIADVSGDGRADLVFLDGVSIHVRLGQGERTFGDAILTPHNGTGRPVVGDYDRDGINDIALVLNRQGVHIHLGAGDGTFGEAALFPGGVEPTGLAAGDLDGDGIIDLAAADQNEKQALVFWGNGDGSFSIPDALPLFLRDGRECEIADLNGDGLDDLVAFRAHTSSATATGTVTIFVSNGDRTFAPPGPSYGIGIGSVGIEVGDMNRDGNLDIVSANDGSADIEVMLGNGDGTFQWDSLSVLRFGVGAGAGGPGMNGLAKGLTDFKLVDVNQNGALDVVVAQIDEINWLLNNCQPLVAPGINLEINLQPGGDGLVLTWPDSLPEDVAVQFTGNFGADAWEEIAVEVTDGPDGTRQAEVPMEGTEGFFRLR